MRQVRQGGFLSDDSDSDYRYHGNLLETDSSSLSPHDVSKVEAYLYYYGIRGSICWGPKLVFRTSKDVFPVPGPEEYARSMRLLPVYEHQELSKDNLWDTICSKVCDLFEVEQSVD